MANYILDVIGSVISVLLFLIGYRQTVGAKKERIVSANSQLERVTLRRIVLESYIPTTAALNRLICGKAMDFRVKAEDLVSPEQLMQLVYTRISESDLIPASQRDSMLSQLAPLLDSFDVLPDALPLSRVVAETDQSLLWYGLASAVIGVGIAFGAYIRTALRYQSLSLALHPISRVLAAFTVSLVGVAVSYAFIHLRSSQTETPSAISEKLGRDDLEVFVLRMLESVNPGQVLRSSRESGIDFVVRVRGKRIGIVVKDPPGRGWLSGQHVLYDQLHRALDALSLDMIYVVTRRSFAVPEFFKTSTQIKLVPAGELRLALS